MQKILMFGITTVNLEVVVVNSTAVSLKCVTGSPAMGEVFYSTDIVRSHGNPTRPTTEQAGLVGLVRTFINCRLTPAVSTEFGIDSDTLMHNLGQSISKESFVGRITAVSNGTAQCVVDKEGSAEFAGIRPGDRICYLSTKRTYTFLYR